MTLTIALAIFLAGFLAGLVNAIAGGGTFITFGALSLVGIPAILANTTSSLTQLPGYITSALAYRAEIQQRWRSAIALCVASALGALAGSLLLLGLADAAFRVAVPWLLLAATLLFAAGPWLKPRADRPTRSRTVLGLAVQCLTAAYGGFFGAGMGVMMLATLGLTQPGDYHRLNALKNLLAIIIALVAVLIFTLRGVIAWTHAAIMIPGVALGGYIGVWAARRLPQTIVRILVCTIGLALAGYLFFDRRLISAVSRGI